MRRLIELAIRRPAVADEDTIKLGPKDGGGFGETASVLDRVHDRTGRRKDPQPPEPAADFPTGFIRTDDRTAADLFA